MNKNAENYLIFIAMIYIAVDLSSMVFTFKIIEYGPVIAAASSLIFPMTYSIMDIIAEVYGYSTAKKIIWYGLVCDILFSILTLGVCHIPSKDHIQNSAYIQVLGMLVRSVLAQSVGVLVGAFLNIYLISKWKVMTNGKYFWLRSIGSSTIGEAAMLVISVLIALTGILSMLQLFHLIIFTYLYKIIFAIVAAPFINFVTTILKYKIGNQYTNHIEFNPFHISHNQEVVSNFQKL